MTAELVYLRAELAAQHALTIAILEERTRGPACADVTAPSGLLDTMRRHAPDSHSCCCDNPNNNINDNFKHVSLVLCGSSMVNGTDNLTVPSSVLAQALCLRPHSITAQAEHSNKDTVHNMHNEECDDRGDFSLSETGAANSRQDAKTYTTVGLNGSISATDRGRKNGYSAQRASLFMCQTPGSTAKSDAEIATHMQQQELYAAAQAIASERHEEVW